MKPDFATFYILWASDFYQRNEILLLCFGAVSYTHLTLPTKA